MDLELGRGHPLAGIPAAVNLRRSQDTGLGFRAEKGVRSDDAAAGRLLDPLRAGELGEGKAAQEDRAERLDVEAHVGSAAGAASAAVGNRPCADVVLEQRVGDDLERHAAVGRVRAPGQRRAHVHRAHPEAVEDLHPERARPGEEVPDLVVEGQEPHLDVVHPVDSEQEAPDLTRPARVETDRLLHPQRALPLGLVLKMR